MVWWAKSVAWNVLKATRRSNVLRDWGDKIYCTCKRHDQDLGTKVQMACYYCNNILWLISYYLIITQCCHEGRLNLLYLLFLWLDELVILYRHLAAQSLSGVSCWAVGINEGDSWNGILQGITWVPSCCLRNQTVPMQNMLLYQKTIMFDYPS